MNDNNYQIGVVEHCKLAYINKIFQLEIIHSHFSVFRCIHLSVYSSDQNAVFGFCLPLNLVTGGNNRRDSEMTISRYVAFCACS